MTTSKRSKNKNKRSSNYIKATTKKLLLPARVPAKRVLKKLKTSLIHTKKLHSWLRRRRRYCSSTCSIKRKLASTSVNKALSRIFLSRNTTRSYRHHAAAAYVDDLHAYAEHPPASAREEDATPGVGVVPIKDEKNVDCNYRDDPVETNNYIATISSTSTDRLAEYSGSASSASSGEKEDQEVHVAAGEVPVLLQNKRDGERQQEMDDVDQRAELFIAKFHQEMRLQRQRSLKEYQEMLSRHTSITHQSP